MRKALLNLHCSQTSGIGLSLFRILFALVVFAEVCQIIYLEGLIFKNLPPFQVSETDPTFFLVAWLGVLVALAAGFHVKIAAICNYLLTLASLGTFTSFEYHLDYAIIGLSFLILFIPSYDPLSLDRFLYRKKRAKTPNSSFPLGYNLLLLFLGAGIVYFDSIFHKIASPMWMAGLGMWQPASLPFAAGLDLTPLLNQKWLMLSLGYLTLIFETVFLFLLPFRKTHAALVTIGFGLHVGIVLAFPIPCFGLGVAALYFLLIPDHWYLRLLRKTEFAERYCDIEGEVISQKHTRFPVNLKLGLTFVGVTLLLQFFCLFESPTGRKFIAEKFPEKAQQIHNFSTSVIGYSTPLLGIHPHGVFMDWHFSGYNHIVSVTHRSPDGVKTRLPLIDERGMPTGLNVGRFWVYYTFRVNAPNLNSQALAARLRDITIFWARKNSINLLDDTFEIMVKKVDSPSGWEKDFLRQQSKRPWQKAGELVWRNRQVSVTMKDIESL
tara:strand:+ start:634 stop:2115 length:1482 start_codon:yes stop_codon:yes gene_type:complete